MTRDELIMENLDLARQIARRFRRALLEYQDLVSEATLALVEAADAYDESIGIEFGLWARVRIKYALLKAAALASERLDRAESINLDSMAGELEGELFDEVWDAVEALPAEDQPVIIQMFGLADGKPQGRKDVGADMGLSEKRVRRVKARSLSRLKHLLRA
jgi:RNA polymerase sigma factor (sigma-70 family)